MEVLTSDVSTLLQARFPRKHKPQDSILTLLFKRKRKEEFKTFCLAFHRGESHACFTIKKQSLATDH